MSKTGENIGHVDTRPLPEISNSTSVKGGTMDSLRPVLSQQSTSSTLENERGGLTGPKVAIPGPGTASSSNLTYSTRGASSTLGARDPVMLVLDAEPQDPSCLTNSEREEPGLMGDTPKIRRLSSDA